MQLSVREVAKILHVQENQVYRWIDAGEIPCHRVNEQTRFSPGEILEWATARGMPVAPDAFPAPETSGGAPPGLADALVLGGIHRKVGGEDRAAVLRSIVNLLPLADLTDREALFQLLLA